MKRIKYLIVLSIMILLTGCGANDGSKILEEALTNMQNVNSGIMEVDVLVAMDGYSIDMRITNAFTERGDAHSSLTASVLGIDVKSESYTILDGDDYYIYTNDNDEGWTYEIIPVNEYVNDEMSVGMVSGFADNYKSVTKVKSDRKGETKLEVVVDKDAVMNALVFAQDLGEEADFELADDFVMNVYIKDGYITCISMNFTDILNIEESSISTYTMNFNISEHNNVAEIAVPKDVYDNAKQI